MPKLEAGITKAKEETTATATASISEQIL